MTTYSLTGTGTELHEVDPISRIEGHLGVKVQCNGGVITDANAHGNLWRGFENFLLGRRPNDPITFTQRICGVCPVPHGLTATYAADAVMGYSRSHITFRQDVTDVDPVGTVGGQTAAIGGYGVSEKAVLIRNLVLGAETLMSSITHFYHLAAPSYIQGPGIPPWTPYFSDSYYTEVVPEISMRATGTGRTTGAVGIVPADGSPGNPIYLWDSVIISYVKALKIRRLTFEAGALFAGRMPMTSCYVAGGVTNDTSTLSSTGGDEMGFAARCAKFKEIIEVVADFIVREYVPIALTLGLLYQDFDSNDMALSIPSAVNNPAPHRGHGAGLGRFLAWGCFPNVANTLGGALLRTADQLLFPGGVKDVNGNLDEFTALSKAQIYAEYLDGGDHAVADFLTEDIAHSRYDVSDADTAAYGAGTAAYPGVVKRTKPARENGYSYMKAPRWKGLNGTGYPCEVGPFARLAVAGIYPVDGSTLTTIPGYVSIFTEAGALDVSVLSVTLATGVVNSGTAAGVNLLGLIQQWVLGLKGGLSTMDRLRARALESLVLVQAMIGSITKTTGTGPETATLSFGTDGWIDQLATRGGQPSWVAGPARVTGTFHGWGAVEAPRGALMHHSTITNNKIAAYQCIVPTTWNGSPKCSNGRNGAIESAMIGAPFSAAGADFTSQDGTTPVHTEGGVEVLRIAQSFDPCIACAVH